MSKKLLEDTKQALSKAKTSIRCEEMARQLRRLGFDVRDGKRGGHKIVFHDGIPGFTSASYNCGHGKNPEIKPAYVNEILKILDLYKDEINNYLETKKP